MNKEEKIFKRVTDILLSRYSFAFMPEKQDISPESRLTEDLGMESIDILDFIMSVETAFDADLNREEVKGVKTLRDVVELLIRQQPSLCEEL